jgi:putative peptidoglycan lipid II flippase
VGPYFFKEPVFALALGVLAGGMLQLGFQFVPVLRRGALIRWPRPLVHPGAIRIGKLLIPRMVGTAVYEMNLLIDTFCASLSFLVGLGGISAIYYSNRIVQFPMGIFGFALSSASLPALSALAAEGNTEAFKRMLLFSLENIFFLMAPAGVVMLVLGEPIIRILFERGAFDRYSTIITSYALFYYALGLLSYGGIKIMSTSFYALHDTRTPVKVAAACLGLTVVLNFSLMGPMKIGGVALASTIAATVNLWFLLLFMEKRIGAFRSELKGYLFKILTASLLTGLVLALAWNAIAGHEAVKFFTLAPLSCMVYFGLCVMLKVEHAGKIMEWISGERKKG